jgi:hypothetical protein
MVELAGTAEWGELRQESLTVETCVMVEERMRANGYRSNLRSSGW